MDHPRIDWDDLRVFLAIARDGSLTAAAARLRLSQPTAGRRLKRLEDACGLALFQRTPAGLVLTEDGMRVRDIAGRMEDQAQALGRFLAGTEQALEGTLKVSSSEWFLHHVLAAPLAAFTARHPGLTLELAAEARLLDLDRREADLVFRFRPFASPDIVQRRFTTVGYGLYAAPAEDLPGIPAPRPQPHGRGHRLITLETSLDAAADMRWLRHHLPEATVSLRSNSRALQALACRQGAGLAVLPHRLAASAGLTRIDDHGAPPDKDVFVGYHRDLRNLPRLRLLLAHLEQTVPDRV
ncbi:LysR family transcriptional regulator [Xanthobacter sp. V4C-4]|uniref:LysR family transcriptional regulator n=1 Tax=Xanthobacter cornucopiae TaxID=3119924 RepID=UPI00372822AD